MNTSPSPSHEIRFVTCSHEWCDFSSWEDPAQGLVEGGECFACGDVLVFDRSLTVTYP